MPYLDQTKISLPKSESDYNVWADYIELLTMLHADRKLSVETIKDRLIDENDGDPQKALKQINAVSRKISSPIIDKIANDQFADDIDPEEEQKIKTALIGVLDYIKCRKAIVTDYYPFSIDDRYTISYSETLNDKQKVYVILLISSLIRIINRDDGHSYRITHRFEELCKMPFSLLTPEIAIKSFFGAGGPPDERPIPAATTFFQKVTELAHLLRLELHPYFTSTAAGVHNVGDGGLDWVAFLPFADTLHAMPTFFAQCACGNDWEEKLFDANKTKWGQYILFPYDYKLYHFIPKSFRDLNNKWLNNLKIHSAVLIDRFRLIELLERSENEAEIVLPYEDLFEELAATSIDFN
jgi:hypothetical protein